VKFRKKKTVNGFKRSIVPLTWQHINFVGQVTIKPLASSYQNNSHSCHVSICNYPKNEIFYEICLLFKGLPPELHTICSRMLPHYSWQGYHVISADKINWKYITTKICLVGPVWTEMSLSTVPHSIALWAYCSIRLLPPTFPPISLLWQRMSSCFYVEPHKISTLLFAIIHFLRFINGTSLNISSLLGYEFYGFVSMVLQYNY
jgi:hypothetical protein